MNAAQNLLHLGNVAVDELILPIMAGVARVNFQRSVCSRGSITRRHMCATAMLSAPRVDEGALPPGVPADGELLAGAPSLP